MGNKTKAVNDYIAKSADFAKPVLMHLRELVHTICPAVEEKIKWGCPHFDYKNSPLCHMAAFKQHCAVGFWKASLMKIDFEKGVSHAMGQMGKLTSVKDLPGDKKLTAYIKEAMRLNDEGIKISKSTPAVKEILHVPDYFIEALSKNKKAQKIFENFAYSHKKEYLQWITEAKTEETRNRRIATALEWIAEGKGRNWRYEKK